MNRYAEAEVFETRAPAPDRYVPEWKSVSGSIQSRSGGSLDMWFQQIREVKIDGGRIVICVPNSFTREWIKEKYGSQILREFKKLTSRDYELHIICESRRAARPPGTRRRAACGAEAAGRGNPFGSSNINEKFTFESFVEGPANQLAAAAARMVAHEPAGAASPVFIHGATGLGKTHLLCAVCHARRRAGKSDGVIYISAESFLNQFVETLSTKNMKEFRDLYRRNCSTLLIDDIQFISSKHKTQEEFFHLFNELYNSGKTIVLASDRPPSQIEKIDEGLRSRFEWGLVVDIRPPDFETRVEIVKAKAGAMGLDLPKEFVVKIAEYARNNVREIEGILIRLQMQSRIRKIPVSAELFKEAVSNFSPRTSVRVAVDDVIRNVAAAYGLKISDIRGVRRHRTVALPRQVAMYICRESLEMSFPEIADRFGGKNHTTVISACRKIRELVKRDLSLLSTIERLTGQLGLSDPRIN
jgi:chromosomal replication initiator protein